MKTKGKDYPITFRKNQGYKAQNHPTPMIPTVTNKQGKLIAPTSSFVENKNTKASINIK